MRRMVRPGRLQQGRRVEMRKALIFVLFVPMLTLVFITGVLELVVSKAHAILTWYQSLLWGKA